MNRPEPLLYARHLQKLANHYGGKQAVQDKDGVFTYAELWAAVEAVSGGLRDAGVKRGDRVAIAMHPSAIHAIVILGCLLQGSIPCTVNIRLTTVETGKFLAPIDPVLVIADTPHEALARNLCEQVVLLDGSLSRGSARDRLRPLWSATPDVGDVSEEDVALIIPTGGTTGLPKGATITHRALWLWCASVCTNGNRRISDVELYYSPFFHVSIITGWMAALFAASNVRILRSFSIDQALQEIATGVTWMSGAPTMWTALMAHPDFAKLDVSSLRRLSFGSMAATPDFIERMLETFPRTDLYHVYGATEFGPVTVIAPWDFREGRYTGVGRVQPGASIQVVDDKLRPLPPGEVGEIVVDCPWRASGYWGNPTETAATFVSSGVKLGDLGSFDADGWLTIAGRKKEMIISGGENVFPNEVEAVLARHPAVRDLTVYGVKDEYWGERVEAAVTLHAGASLTHAELVEFGRKELAGYKLPKSLRVVDTIPLTSMNKPDRRRLGEDAARAPA